MGGVCFLAEAVEARRVGAHVELEGESDAGGCLGGGVEVVVVAFDLDAEGRGQFLDCKVFGHHLVCFAA